MDWMGLLAVVIAQIPNFAGVLFPFLITVVNTNVKGSKMKFLSTVGVCLVGAVVFNVSTVVDRGAWESVPAVFDLWGKILIEATGVYHLFYNNTKAESGTIAFIAKVQSLIKKPA